MSWGAIPLCRVSIYILSKIRFLQNDLSSTYRVLLRSGVAQGPDEPVTIIKNVRAFDRGYPKLADWIGKQMIVGNATQFFRVIPADAFPFIDEPSHVRTPIPIEKWLRLLP